MEPHVNNLAAALTQSPKLRSGRTESVSFWAIEVAARRDKTKKRKELMRVEIILAGLILSILAVLFME